MSYLHSYEIDRKYSTSVAYFSMEFAIHQALKIYSGGLGFLAGSHMYSSYELKQNMVGIGILWSYGYYDQSRNENRYFKAEFRRKEYYFLKDLDISVSVRINDKDVIVKAYLVPSDVFNCAPLILLSTDIKENDYLSRTITHKLYDGNNETRVAQEIVLGIAGIKVLEALKLKIDIYHMNEGHALPLAFELLKKYKDIKKLKKSIVFTTHTPEKAGNEEYELTFLSKMGFFAGLELDEIKNTLRLEDEKFSLTIGALKVAKIANGVSKIHADVANEMWKTTKEKCEIIAITNAQNKRYWADKVLSEAMDEYEDYQLEARKKHLKKQLFIEVANQTGKMFNPEVLTIVWARRFAEYKRPGLLKYDMKRFEQLVSNQKYPIQIIWAGKPYPFDAQAISIFNDLINMSHNYNNIAVLVGYELELSKKLKRGSDIWLNNPRRKREASGTSGMTAAMNGSINLSISDGWHPEFCKNKINSFTILTQEGDLLKEEEDKLDNLNLMNILEKEIIPLYYNDKNKWTNIMKNSISDVIINFDSARMVNEYYEKMYLKI